MEKHDENSTTMLAEAEPQCRALARTKPRDCWAGPTCCSSMFASLRRWQPRARCRRLCRAARPCRVPRHPASAMHDEAFDRAKTVIAYCASGENSALVSSPQGHGLFQRTQSRRLQGLARGGRRRGKGLTPPMASSRNVAIYANGLITMLECSRSRKEAMKAFVGGGSGRGVDGVRRRR